MDHPPELQGLADFVARTPGCSVLSSGLSDTGWWLKFRIDLGHALAWAVVQEYGHVLNMLSLEERLPTRFLPVSPPPYVNGGPEAFLSWVIECDVPRFAPSVALEWLKGRLPRPVDDLSQWTSEDAE